MLLEGGDLMRRAGGLPHPGFFPCFRVCCAGIFLVSFGVVCYTGRFLVSSLGKSDILVDIACHHRSVSATAIRLLFYRHRQYHHAPFALFSVGGVPPRNSVCARLNGDALLRVRYCYCLLFIVSTRLSVSNAMSGAFPPAAPKKTPLL